LVPRRAGVARKSFLSALRNLTARNLTANETPFAGEWLSAAI
jgi:hypothetical protein